MKLFILALLLSSFACGRESSPEGRSQIRDETLQGQVNSLKHQHIAILDSISQINREIRALKATR